jgi:hypothetical protein
LKELYRFRLGSTRVLIYTFWMLLGKCFKMIGLIGFAPIYFNALLALLFVFIFPGMVIVRAFNIPDFPQRWFVVFLSSLTANYFLVTLIAELHLDPLQTCRAVAIVLAAILAALFVVAMRPRTDAEVLFWRDRSIVRLSDLGWLFATIGFVAIAYISIWKHGVPSIFGEGDVSISWNSWALTWAQGSFPTGSYGYPQFVPAIWALTYIFTGSTAQYFAYYIFIVLIVAPILLGAMNLGRMNWWLPLVAGFSFGWFIFEIRDPWLKASMPAAFPDWVAAVAGFSGAVSFIVNRPAPRFDREKICAALIALCLLAIAASTKPTYGLFAVSVLIAICVDAVRFLDRKSAITLIAAAICLLSAFILMYLLNYSHLSARVMPNYPISERSERLAHAAALFNASFSLPFRIVAVAGLAMCPFLPRIRWLALPLLLGFWIWADKAGYDLRNVLGFIVISAFIPVFAAARAWLGEGAVQNERQWRVLDMVAASVVAILAVGLTLPLAKSDARLERRFHDDQLIGGSGYEFNRDVEKLLSQGCVLFSSSSYFWTVSAFAGYKQQLNFFHFTQPLLDDTVKAFDKASGCVAIVYPLTQVHPSISEFIAAKARERGLTKVIEVNGNELIASNP